MAYFRFLIPVCWLGACAWVAGCGGDTESGPGRTADNPRSEDGGSPVDDDTDGGANADDDEPTDDDDAMSDDDSSDDDEPSTPTLVDLVPDEEDLTPPPTLLPEADPDATVSELSDEEFEELCEPYVDTATSAVGGLGALCALGAIATAQDSEAATLEEYRRACGQARLECEGQAAAAAEIAESLECADQDMCEATVEQVRTCYERIYVLNEAILVPLGGAEIPSCEELTPAAGGAILGQVLLYLAQTSTVVEDSTGVTVDDASDPCEEVEALCPGIALPASMIVP